MDMDFDRPRKRRLLILQLAPMIDVFVLIIVFLLKATVLSGVSITWPSDLKTAKSQSKEGVETASQVVVSKEFVELKMIEKKFPLKTFKDAPEAEKKAIGAELAKYIETFKSQEASALFNVNLIADADLQYQELFPVIAFLRMSGFNSILFIAEGEARPAAAGEGSHQ